MSRTTKGVLIFIGLVFGLVLLFFGFIYVFTLMVGQTAEKALSPIRDTNRSLETRVAEFLNPTPTILPNPVTILHEVRSLSRLETIQYTMEKVITAEEGQGDLAFLFGDRLLFVGHGTVIAGIDMAKMRPEDMWVENNVLYVRLPAAEIFVVDIDNDKSYVYDRDTGLLSKGDINLERAARLAAEQEIQKSALEDGILNQANENAQSYMSRLLIGLGFPDVVFVDPEQAPAEQPTPQP